MTNSSVRLVAGLLVLVALRPIHAEVATDLQGSATSTLIMGIISENPDPIGAFAWQAFRPIAPERILNPSGFVRGDGTPDATTKPDGSPVVVWAYNVGPDHDAAIAEWDGTAWGSIGFLATSGEDELDPRIAVEANGAVHVAWWTAGDGLVWLRTRQPGSGVWDAPVLVTYGGEHGRRPSVLVVGGVLRVAYERDSSQPGMSQDVVVAAREAGGSFTMDVVASSARTARLDPQLHAEAGATWLDWKHDAGEFGSAGHDGSAWTLGPPAAWADPSWVGAEEARGEIRRRVLGP